MRHHAFAAAMGLATAAFLAPGSQSQAASADPTGYWMKPDAERESKIQVFKCGNGKKLLCAKIAWLKEPNDSKGKPLHDIRNENPHWRIQTWFRMSEARVIPIECLNRLCPGIGVDNKTAGYNVTDSERQRIERVYRDAVSLYNTASHNAI